MTRRIWSRDERQAYMQFVAENIYNYCFVDGCHCTFTSKCLSKYCGLSSNILGRHFLLDLLNQGYIYRYNSIVSPIARYAVNRDAFERLKKKGWDVYG